MQTTLINYYRVVPTYLYNKITRNDEYKTSELLDLGNVNTQARPSLVVYVT